ncbi:Asparaginase/glutaminase [Fusarium redolens]|uniref:Asparaginase/glutaminase n=1 Tax=Fusarium redolens TaxID=48865 RepID=A0A9P9FWJ6_FUSRE|nr:Asparaginase/glutaminase [Fusarium redolens]KAH7208422.1 Asparaginase/glutaminase [Fusarium redolens]
MNSLAGWKLVIVAAILVLTFFIGPYDVLTRPPTVTSPGPSTLPLPTVAIIATGGPALGKGNSPTDTSHYVSGAYNINDAVVSILPDLEGIAHIVTEQILSIDSIDIGTEQLIIILHTVMKYLRRPEISGVVLVLGSSKLTLVARFLEHTIALDYFNKSVCLTAAPKPLTAHGAEGPGSILSATKVSVASHDNRILIVFNDLITLARRSYKQNNVLFSGDRSLLGRIVDFGPEMIHRPSNSPKTFQFDEDQVYNKTKTKSKYFPSMSEERDFDIATKEGVKGAVLGVFEDGYWPQPLMRGLNKLMNQPDVIVAAVPYGFSFNMKGRIDGVVPAGDWTDRDLMMIMPFLLASNMSREEILDFIETPYNEI